MQTFNVTIRVYVLRLLRLSDYPKHKINCWSRWQPLYHSALQFSLAPVVLLYFGSHFRIALFLCRNPDPGKMFCMVDVANAAATSEFDLSCRPLSAQRACMTNTGDARTNLMSRFVWSSARCVRSTFDDYRYIITGTTFISYQVYYQQYSMIPGTKGQSTFHLIRYTYVSGTCMYAMNTSHT